MPKLPRITAADALRALQRDGWQVDSQSGSHIQLKHPTKPGRVTVAVDPGTIPVGTLGSIIRQAGLTADQFRALL